MMPSLLDLPVELFDRVCSCEGEIAPKIWCSLAPVNKHLNALVTPLLYREVVFALCESFRSPYFQDIPRHADPTRFPLFARTVLSSPEKAAMVQSLAIHNLQNGYPDWPPQPSWPPEQSFDNVRNQRIDGFFDGNEEGRNAAYLAFTSKKHRHELEYIVPFTIALLPNLLALSLSTRHAKVWGNLDYLMRITLRKPGESRPGFKALKYLHVEVVDEEKRVAYQPLCHAFELPSLEHIRCIGKASCLAREILPASVNATAKLSNVRKLELLNCDDLGKKSLHKLLGGFSRLESFKIFTSGKWMDLSFNAHDVQNALAQQKSTLRFIFISFNFYSRPIQTEETPLNDEVNGVGEGADQVRNGSGPMDFSQFERLETLEIALPFIFGQEALQLDFHGERGRDHTQPTEDDLIQSQGQLLLTLPKSIQNLKVTYCGDEWAGRRLNLALLELLKFKEDRFPCLSKLSLSVSKPLLYYKMFFTKVTAYDMLVQLEDAIHLARRAGLYVALETNRSLDESKNMLENAYEASPPAHERWKVLHLVE